MLRPKSAGGSRSFLDDLLGSEQDSLDSAISSASGQRQRKSVRFFDQDEADASAARNRPHSSTLDSLLNASRPEAAPTRPRSSDLTGTRSKADWLGLDSEEADTSQKVPSEQASSSTALGRREMASSQPSRTTLSRAGASSEPEDWITAGLRARQSKPVEPESRPSFLQTPSSAASTSRPPATAAISPSEPRPWQPRIAENAQAPAAAPASITTRASALSESQAPAVMTGSSSEPVLAPAGEKPQPSQVTEGSAISAPEHDGEASNASDLKTQSAVFLQTKLRILSLEKTFLEQTVSQMRDNHQEELKSMVSLYEQQMRMTSEMYKRHEEMIQEERDRRIAELKSQLDHSEREMTEMREKFKQRLATVESEWQADVQRIRDNNLASTRLLVEQHQDEVQRLEQRLRADGDSAMKTSTDLVKQHSKSVTELLAKWEHSAYTIEQLQKSVVARQEDIIRQQSLEGDNATSRKFADFEMQWKAFLADMEEQRAQMEEVIRGELEKNNSEEKRHIEEERTRAQDERKELEAMKVQFSAEVNEWRQREGEQAEKWRLERETLRRDVLLFEERRSLLETLYNDRKRAVEEEMARVSKQSEEFAARRTQLDEEQVQLKRTALALAADQQQLAAKKVLFDREKEQLAQMAVTLANRADELEKLSEVALKEKLDGINAIDEMDSIQSEIDSKMASIEDSAAQLRKEEQRLAMERAQLEQQWAMLRELRESIVCNLCGSAINRGGQAMSMLEDGLLPLGPATAGSNYSIAMFSQRATSRSANRSLAGNRPHVPMFQGLLNGGYFLSQGTAESNDMSAYWLGNSNQAADHHDQDQKLLYWQMSAQQDAASLAEETKFLRVLRKSSDNK